MSAKVLAGLNNYVRISYVAMQSSLSRFGSHLSHLKSLILSEVIKDWIHKYSSNGAAAYQLGNTNSRTITEVKHR